MIINNNFDIKKFKIVGWGLNMEGGGGGLDWGKILLLSEVKHKNTKTHKHRQTTIVKF